MALYDDGQLMGESIAALADNAGETNPEKIDYLHGALDHILIRIMQLSKEEGSTYEEVFDHYVDILNMIAKDIIPPTHKTLN